jgi:type IV pilus assembly protein PilP
MFSTLALGAAFWLVIQTGDATPKTPAAPAAEATTEGAKPTQPELPAFDPFSYTYSPFGKRDPFETFVRAGDSERPASPNPLLNYDLDKFMLTGIVWGMANPRAIVRDGGGQGHIIGRGTRIGRNRGRVVRVLRDRVVVAEEFRDPLGKLVVSEYSMILETDGK